MTMRSPAGAPGTSFSGPWNAPTGPGPNSTCSRCLWGRRVPGSLPCSPSCFPRTGPEWFSDQLNLAADPKVRAEALQGVVMVEVAEMTGSTRAEIQSLKAFLSRTNDGGIRLAWRRNPEPMPRRCILVGTSNEAECLPNDWDRAPALPGGRG